MQAKPFHLGWFLQGSSVQAWGEAWTGHIGTTWMKPDLFLDMARCLERACFDYLLIEDSSYVGESYAGSTELYLKSGIAVPRQDPSVVAALMCAVTSRIGIVPTFGTYAYPPYLLARLVGTLDEVSAGRIGWNVVTGSSDYAAMNFGLPGMPEHDLRYEMADEYMEVVRGLWGSWEQDAFIANTETGVLVDHTKVHATNFSGTWYKTRGPLNSGPLPQGQPVIAQAGGSPRGRQFAAQHADTIVVHSKGIADMKAYRDDVRARMVAHGRDPDSCKVLFLVSPVFGETAAETAERKRLHTLRAEAQIPAAPRVPRQDMATLTSISARSTSTCRLRPGLKTTTATSRRSTSSWTKLQAAKSLREVMLEQNTMEGSVELIGTIDQVAAQMAEAMQEVGGGRLFAFAMPNVTRRLLRRKSKTGCVPALQRRGLVRRAYAHEQFRNNLLEF